MRRCFLVISCLLLCLALKSQSLRTCRYWFDQNHEQALTTTFDGDFFQMEVDAGAQSAGLHNLYLMVQDTTGIWCAPRSYLFYQTSAELPVIPSEVLCHFWFDQDFAHKQTMPFGTGQFLLNADGLNAGIHLLNVLLENDGLTSTEHYLFYQTSAELSINPSNVVCHFWFDQDFAHKLTMPFGTGQFLLNAGDLEAGLHLLNVALEKNGLTTTEQYLFYQASAELPANPSDVVCHFWFDQDYEHVQMVPFGSGQFLLDVPELEDGTHVVNIMLKGDELISAQSYSFEKGGGNGYVIITIANPMEGGFVVGGGTFEEGDSCIIEATANEGFTFGNWTKEGVVVSENPTYDFTVTESGTYVANFDCVPIDEFTYMSPTDNFPFSSLPITFSWDAVSGAEYYNLYLWNANEPAPSTPFAGNIYNRSCYVSSLQNHQTYNWYVEAVNTCFSMTSSVRSFSLNIPPIMNVSASSLNFGEVALNNSNTRSLYVSGNALDEAFAIQITGEDASMFSYVQSSNWNGLTGGSLSVTFSPTAVQYSYNANLVITSGTTSQTVQLTGSLADMFVFNTYVEQDVFPMNSTVPIYGTVMDLNNNPAPSAEVEVKVTVMNMTRSLLTTTGADGHFSVDFVPTNSESGYYTINSGRVWHNSTAVHDDFNIPGMNLVTNDWILWDVVQNETSTGSIVIRNRSQISLNNIQVTAGTLPEGCSFTFQPLSLAGMEEGVLEYNVSGTTPTNGYQEVALVATSSEGASMNFTVWYRCAEPRGILYAAPNNITTTMTKRINKIVDVMLYNNGTGPTGSVYLDIPSVDWLSVVGNDTLPSIAVHDSAYFSLRLSANENTPLVQYTGNIAINCERGDGLLLPYTIMAVSDSTGTLIVDVTDDYTYNGNGQHLSGATVTVKGYYSLQTVAVGLTDSNGQFTVNDILEGYYRISITAPHHAEYQAVILIEGGQTNTQDIYLQYQAINYSWVVVHTEIQDEYTFELVVEYETNVPVPVVVIDMPQTFPDLEPGESWVFNYVVSNQGLVDAYEATLYPPTDHPLYDFTPLITEIDTLHAQTSVVIPCTMTARTRQRSPLVYAALNGKGDRDGDCPDMAKTKVQSYYYCGGEKIYVTGYRWVQIGSHPCDTPPGISSGGVFIPTSSGSSSGSGGGSSSSSSSTPPIVIVHNQGCDPDDCLSGVMDDIDSCPNDGGTPPNLPPRNPSND